MKYMAKYSRACWGDDVKSIQNQCQQTLYTEELCSINTIKDNPKLFENTLSPTDVISEGFYQSEAQKALKNSQIEKAFEVENNTFRGRKENSIGFSTHKRKKL